MPVSQTQSLTRQRPILRISTPNGARLRWLDHGKPGNFQTAAEMALLVRDAAMRDEGLQAFAAGLLLRAGLDSHSDVDSILDTVFRFVQNNVKYIADPGGSFDAISSARETLSKRPVPYGDCDDLSVLLASLLACLGFTPSFVMAKYSDATSGFDHIYVQVETKDGGAIALDPTSRTHGIGWESPKYIDRVVFPIFGKDGGFNSLAGAIQVATAGATIGLNFVPVVGPLLSALAAPFASLFDKSKQKSEEAARWAGHEQVMQAMDQIQSQIDACQITPSEGAQLAQQIVSQYYAACDQNFSSKVAKSCRNYGSEPGGFDYRVAQIANRLAPGCAVISGPGAVVSTGGSSQSQTVASGASGTQTAAGSVSDGGLGGLSDLLPVALIGLGAIVILKNLRG